MEDRSMRDITLINVKNFETLAPATILSTSPGFTLCILPLPLTPRPCCSLLVFPSFLVFPSRLSRRGENPLRTRRVIESAKGKMKRAMMIYLLFEESPGEIAYARAISYVISAVYIYF